MEILAIIYMISIQKCCNDQENNTQMINREKLKVEEYSEFDSHGINKNDILFYARIMERVGIYEILELKVRTITPTYFVGCEKHSKQSFLFGYNAVETKVFKDRMDALNAVKKAESKNIKEK